MDTYSSIEDLLIKTRKPYTISKQRERWTEEEHNRFLEALKLYGRAWQRIEEHIGTKTAVQIRSHAQKFFTKLEKEALVKGVPVGQALDIDIPPPRPKRKPSNPYPRKTGLGTSGPQLGAKDPSPEKSDGDERTGYGNDTQNENDCSEVLNLFQGASCTSLSSANRNCRSATIAPRNARTFKEFVPIRKMAHDDETNNTVNLEKAPENPFQSEKTNANFHPENCGELSSNDMQTTQNYPKHAPVHVLKPYFSYTEAAAVSANTRHVPTHPSFDPFFHSNQDNYQAYLQASSVFSGLIVSSLLQNPAAHAAASFAASFWPCPNIEACSDSLSSSSTPPPGMAAVAAATVAAATAWWTAHGLLPLSPPPFHNSMIVNPSTVSAAINVADKSENELSLQDQQQKQSSPKSPTVSSSDSEKGEGTDQNAGVSASPDNEEATTAMANPNNTKRTLTAAKTVDRSSCGSNTPSGSEAETDALKTHALEKAEEEQADDLNHPDCDSNSGRAGSRSSYMTNDSWKEVSEEGRLAFQALFSREVLPQSFWPSNGMRNKGNQTKNLETDQQKNENEKVEDEIELDLNSNMWGSCYPSHQVTSFRSESNEKLLQWTMDIGQGKLKARGTGFKPYKRLRFS